MPQWRQVEYGEGDGHWVQWADLRLSDAWFRRALEIATSSPSGIVAQRAAVQDAWTALSNAFRSIDTPPYNSPQVRGAIRRAYGTHGYESDLAVPGNYWSDGANPGTTDGTSSLVARARAMYNRQRPGSASIIIVKIRAMLDQRGLPLDPCASPAGECYSPAPYWMNSESDPHQIFGGEADWENWGFWDGGPFAWLAAENVGKVLPPLKWSMDIAREIAEQCVALGSLEVLVQARLNAVLLNFAMARKHGLLTNTALLIASENIPAQIYAAQYTDQTQSSKVAAQGMIAIGTAIIAAGAASGSTGFGGLSSAEIMVVGACIAAAGYVVSFAPSAVGPAYSDMFGRAEPVYERPNISGGAGGATDPSRLAVPDPPGYTPAREINLGAVVVVDTCRPPSEFYSAALRQVWIDQHPQCPVPPPFQATKKDGGWGPILVGGLLLGSLWKIVFG